MYNKTSVLVDIYNVLKEINKNNGIIPTKQVLKLDIHKSELYSSIFFTFCFIMIIEEKKKYFNCLGKRQAKTIKFF